MYRHFRMGWRYVMEAAGKIHRRQLNGVNRYPGLSPSARILRSHHINGAHQAFAEPYPITTHSPTRTIYADASQPARRAETRKISLAEIS